MNVNKKDVLVLLAWAFTPVPLLLVLRGNFFLSIVLYCTIPGVYFSLKRPGITLKAVIVSAAGMSFVCILDYIAFLNRAWAIPTIFPFRILNLIPFEDFFFTFWAVYVTIAASHYFFPRIISAKINKKRVIGSGAFILGFFILFLCLYFFVEDVLIISYYDAWLMFFAFIIPALTLFYKYPSYRVALVSIIAFQFILFLPYEIIAGKLGFWTFPSAQYLGWVHILGFTFPIEEFLEWMIFFAPAALAFCKFTADPHTSTEFQG